MGNDQEKSMTPYFIIHIDGSRLAVEKEVEIKEILVEENVDKPSFSRITITDDHSSWADNSDIKLGTAIKISLGYKDDYTEVFQGEITGMGSKFTQSGGKNFEILSHNKLHRLTRVKKTKAYKDMKYPDIIKQIAGDSNLQNDIDSIGPDMKFCMQRNKSDYDFLMEIAKKYNCKVFMDKDKLCFKILKSGGQDEETVEWSKSLMDFQVEMDSSQILTAAETRGWDAEKLEAIVGSKTYNDISATIGGSEVGGKAVNDNFSENKIVVIDEHIIDKESADNLALDLLTENSFNYVVARAKIKGNPKINAGTNISVQAVGTKFSGSYYVKAVKHFLSVGLGYSTYVIITRNAV